MSRVRTRQRLDNQVANVKVKTRHLLGQASGEVVNAFGGDQETIRTAQVGTLDGDFSAISVVHRGSNGKVVGRSSFAMGEVDPGHEVSVVSEEGISAVRAISDKAEKLVATAARAAARKGWSSEFRFTIAEGRDLKGVKLKHGLCDSDPIAADLETVARVETGRLPGTSFSFERVRKARQD